MGKVWRARHIALKRDDALKVLPDAFASDPDRLARFQREAQVLASLNHPNIAHVYGLEQTDGVQALVMNWSRARICRSGSLADLFPSMRHSRSHGRSRRLSKLLMSRGSFIAI
jgi:serine/threonine protein kinase